MLAILACALLTLGLTALCEPARAGWAALGALAAGAVAAVLFVRAERVARAPLVPLALFASRTFTGANLLTLFLYGALAASLFLLPFELMTRRGFSPSQVGITLLPLGLLIGVLARLAGKLADRIGPRRPIVAGAGLVAAAAAVMAVAPPGLGLGIVAPIALLGVGMSLVVAPLTTAVMNAAPDALAGAASGINNAASRLAGLFAVAIASAATLAVFGAAAGEGNASFGVLPPAGDPAFPALSAAFDAGYAAGQATAAILAALAAAVAWATFGPAPTEKPRRAT